MLRIGTVVLHVLQRLQRGTLDDRNVVAGEVVAAQQFAYFHFNQLQQLLVVQQVNLVQEDHDVGHAYLTGQQDVLAGLGHGAVGSGHQQDRAVHLRSAGDHVLYIVGMAGAVHVSIVTLFGLVLYVGGVDGNAAGALFGRLIDFVITHLLRMSLAGQHHRDGGRQGRLAVVNVADRADVYMRLIALKLLLSHGNNPPL